MKKKFIKPVVMIGKIQTPTLCAGSFSGESTSNANELNGGSLGSKGSFFDDEDEF